MLEHHKTQNRTRRGRRERKGKGSDVVVRIEATGWRLSQGAIISQRAPERSLHRMPGNEVESGPGVWPHPTLTLPTTRTTTTTLGTTTTTITTTRTRTDVAIERRRSQQLKKKKANSTTMTDYHIIRSYKITKYHASD